MAGHHVAGEKANESYSQKLLEQGLRLPHCRQMGAATRQQESMETEMRRLAKTGSYWVVHITVAVSVAWALTGNLAAAMAIGLLEPTVQAFVFYLHEWLWERKAATPALAVGESPA
jgi:uncharacterized membrane protein